ncbi:MAG: DUF4410 domain-containing protein [Campylobacter sp.]|nr:DUF4410 domain-containing protein [Campylobacter sp.]
MKIRIFLIALFGIFFFSGCNSTKLQQVEFKEDQKIYTKMQPKCGDSEEEQYLQKQIERFARKKGVLGDELLIDCRILNYDEGNRALRYFIGFGAGQANTIIHTKVINDNNVTIGEFGVEAVLRGGIFGGNDKKMLVSSASLIYKQVMKNFIDRSKR